MHIAPGRGKRRKVNGWDFVGIVFLDLYLIPMISIRNPIHSPLHPNPIHWQIAADTAAFRAGLWRVFGDGVRPCHHHNEHVCSHEGSTAVVEGVCNLLGRYQITHPTECIGT